MLFYMECTSITQFQLATSGVTQMLLKASRALQTSVVRNKTILPSSLFPSLLLDRVCVQMQKWSLNLLHVF